ncbi:hypothetical protein PQ689_03345 [Thermoanaerobacterium thermosaccharolyticum]|uniref:hypothetical protein n=1 Tax=Thermoanaerobacterium thermosaccharolyticum TaxID=1517 RepID=UPI003DA9A4CA
MKLGISIDEFWNYTTHEITLIAEAKKFQKEEQLHLMAWAVAHIISYTGRLKRPVSPSKLLGKKKEHKTKPIKDKKQAWNELMKKFRR